MENLFGAKNYTRHGIVFFPEPTIGREVPLTGISGEKCCRTKISGGHKGGIGAFTRKRGNQWFLRKGGEKNIISVLKEKRGFFGRD